MDGNIDLVQHRERFLVGTKGPVFPWLLPGVSGRLGVPVCEVGLLIGERNHYNCNKAFTLLV